MATFRSAPLWAQVLAIWGTAIPVGLLLALLNRWLLPPWRFYWLIPYPPSVWGWLRVLWGALRMWPLLVSAVAVVPSLALLGTVAVVALRLVSRRVGTG
jgi:hypothetical protein